MQFTTISKNKNWLAAAAVAGALMPATATLAENHVESEVAFKVDGSDTIGLGLMSLLMQAYGTHLEAETTISETDVPLQFMADYIGENGFGDNIEAHLVTSTNSSQGFRALLEGTADIGMASRRIRREEARALRDSGAGSMIAAEQEHILAVDSVVVITHPENPVDTLSVRQLADIYKGNIRNWSEVGGDDMPIVVAAREVSSGTGALFNERILGDADAQLSPAAVRMTDNESVAAIVNKEPSVIGFVGFAFQRGAQPVTLINDCRISMAPDTFSARTEEYLLQRRLYLYNRIDTLPQAASDFLEFVKSPEVDGVILKSGFVDLGVERRAMPLNGSRALALINTNADAYEGDIMRGMLIEMVNHDRLSTTFRFATGSSRLDERAIVDLERLSAYLETQPEGTEVRFVGFTDDVGQFAGNLALSEERANRVLGEVANYAQDRLAGINMTASGYGEISPAGCNSDADGQRVNRRVEVWIKNG